MARTRKAQRRAQRRYLLTHFGAGIRELAHWLIQGHGSHGPKIRAVNPSGAGKQIRDAGKFKR